MAIELLRLRRNSYLNPLQLSWGVGRTTSLRSTLIDIPSCFLALLRPDGSPYRRRDPCRLFKGSLDASADDATG